MNIEELKRQLKQLSREARTLCEKAEDAGRNFTAAEKSVIDGLTGEMDRLRLEIKTAERGGGRAAEMQDLKKSIDNAFGDGVGDLMMGGDAGTHPDSVQGKGAWSKAFIANERAFSAGGGRKALVPSGTVTVPGISATITTLSGPAQTILQLIPVETLEGTDAFAFLRETVRTNNAAAVAAGSVKPTSVYSLEKVEDRARVIAHLTEPMARQTVSDVPLLRQYIDGALREGVILALEDMIFNGDEDTTDEFDGLVNTSGVQNSAWDTNILTSTRKAVTALQVVSITPSGWAMHPNDWEAVELAALATYAANSNQRGPVEAMTRKLWGLPVALSTAVTEGYAWLADWRGSMVLREREGVQIDWSENVVSAEGVSDFTVNQVRFRGEARYGFGVTRPRGVVLVDVNAGS